MRIATIRSGGRVTSALNRDGLLVDLSSLASRLDPTSGPFPWGRGLVEACVAGDARVRRVLDHALTAGVSSLPCVADPVWLPAVPDPTQVFAIGLNYLSHCREQGREPPSVPIFFHKAVSCLSGHLAPVVAWPVSREVDFEGELAVVIGRGGRGIPEAEALSHVFGYTVMNDVTARDLQRSDRQWSRSKGLDTFGPMGPAVVTADEVPDPAALRIRTFVNGALVQDSLVSDMIFTVARLVAHVSEAITLRPGDVISTGTPAGVGVFADPPRFLKAGDEVVIRIDGVGELRNPVVAAQ